MRKSITINFVVSEKDPMINIDSDDFSISYTDVARTGRGANMHGLQCGFVESDNPEKYKKLMELCDTIANASREIYELNK